MCGTRGTFFKDKRRGAVIAIDADKLEQLDTQTMEEFGRWLEAEGLQAIGTRVSTGDECSIIIEDGYVKGDEHFISTENPTAYNAARPVMQSATPTWKAGSF